MEILKEVSTKIVVLVAAMVLASVPMMAQHGGHHHHDGTPAEPSNDAYTLTLKAYGSELFRVYLDGDVVNRRAQREVTVMMRDNMPHDVYVVMERPAEKIAMVVYTPRARREECRVYYNSREDHLELALPQHGGFGPGEDPEHQGQERPGLRSHCSDEEVDLMVDRMKAEDFDSGRDRLAMGYVMQHSLSARQIMRLCMEFSFESNKVDFLKRAYPYCVDPEHYEVVTEALAFNSNKKDIRDMMKNNRR